MHSFFISLTVPEYFDPVEYPKQAGIMANIFVELLTNKERIHKLTKGVPISSCHSEVDVMQHEDKLVGRAVVEFESETRVTLDKTQLSKLLKSAAPWEKCKVEKRSLELADHGLQEASEHSEV